MITFGCPFFGLYGSTPGSTSPTSSSNIAYNTCHHQHFTSVQHPYDHDPTRIPHKRTFCTTFFLFASLPLSAPPSREAFTLAFTFCLSEATSLTLTSVSNKAAHTSLRRASRTYSARVSIRSTCQSWSRDHRTRYIPSRLLWEPYSATKEPH